MSFFNLNSRTRTLTFKPKKIEENKRRFLLKEYTKETLGSGSLARVVRLPEGEDLNEWLASNTVDFYNQINMLYGTITEFCLSETCPMMSAGSQYEYLWQDSNKYKKPTKMSAPEYIETLLQWVLSFIDDESVFPTKNGFPFPKCFSLIIRQIYKRLFRVYAHIYCHHFSAIVALGEEAHLNTSFKHFIFFVNEFNLIEKKEYAPLQELVDSFITNEK
ncbi:hypothetical protein PNEG_00553 [Pneumocystis murina B123]|uniref:Maintenance of ploidy protein mob1 n=1 Tax=Pneumocystis murina (strain B123) TaxID=1069680 RepID=M7PCB3_PNEMU|nr:hypothetical protein PNEG_00553 [Pneumocystis murina B123]EMR11545.1 hypothetical protein PNEG_00553 [Pneumocystis murina B123]